MEVDVKLNLLVLGLFDESVRRNEEAASPVFFFFFLRSFAHDLSSYLSDCLCRRSFCRSVCGRFSLSSSLAETALSRRRAVICLKVERKKEAKAEEIPFYEFGQRED